MGKTKREPLDRVGTLRDRLLDKAGELAGGTAADALAALEIYRGVRASSTVEDMINIADRRIDRHPAIVALREKRGATVPSASAPASPSPRRSSSTGVRARAGRAGDPRP